MHQEYRETFRNHEVSSGFLTGDKTVANASETHLTGMNLSQEDAGLEINPQVHES